MSQEITGLNIFGNCMSSTQFIDYLIELCVMKTCFAGESTDDVFDNNPSIAETLILGFAIDLQTDDTGVITEAINKRLHEKLTECEVNAGFAEFDFETGTIIKKV